VAKTLFEAIGYKLGEKAAQARNAFELMGGGSEEDALRAEIRLGREMAAAVLQRTPLVEENDWTQFAAEIGLWLGGQVTDRKLPFVVRATAEEHLGMLGLPGGPVFMSWPLLEICQGERDEIAFLLAHEMGHIVRRHTVERLIRDSALTLLLRQAPGRHALGGWLSKAGQQLLSAAFSKEEEFEADAFAADLVRTAGGDICSGERVLEKLSQPVYAQGVRAPGSYFGGHPPLAERLARLQARRLPERRQDSQARKMQHS
jgi:Zn-dependent protease with chaperone function